MDDNRLTPLHWKQIKLGDLGNIILGQSPPSNTYNTVGLGLPFFQGKAEFCDVHPIATKWCSAPQKIAEPNDILISVRAPVGATNIANLRCCIGRGLAAIRTKNYKFIYYFLKSRQTKIEELGTGTTFKAISGDNLKNILVPVFSDNEQEQIVEKIEELFSELDAGRRQLETIKEQLKTYRQAVLKYAFEGRLTNKCIINNESPSSWKLVKLHEVCEKIIGGGTPKTDVPEYWTGNIPWISSADIFGIRDVKPRRKITLKAVKESATNILPKDGIIIVTRVGLGKVAIAPCDICFSQDNQGIVLNSGLVNKEYALHYLLYAVQSLVKNSRGTTINGVTKKQLSDLKFILPPLDEQMIVVKGVEFRLSVCDKIEKTIEFAVKQTESLKQSILKQAFEGKLV